MARELTVGLPYHVDKRRSRNVNHLDAHALDIIQTRDETLEVTAVSKLGFSIVDFIGRPKIVVICRITICKLV